MAILDRIGSSAQSAVGPRKVISRQVRHLTKLVDDLLDVARVTSGKIILDSRPLNLASVVGQSLMILQETGRLANHQLSVDCVEVWAIADATRIQQIVANLVENSVKYTPSGGKIAVSVVPADGNTVLEVSDTGVGLSADLLPRVLTCSRKANALSTAPKADLVSA
jgi:signal transduction histidine kinase